MTNIKKIWNSIRILKRFDIVSLQLVCIVHKTQKISKKTIVNYCALLVRAGYLKKDNGMYILVKNTGSLAVVPVKVKGKVNKVFDSNLQKFINLKAYSTKISNIEEAMKRIVFFTVLDITKLTTSQNNAKFYIHRLIKKGKVIKHIDLKGYNHRLTQYKYIG